MTVLQRHPVTTPLMKFRVNIGQHVGVDKNGETRLWNQGQICETPTHLTKRFGNEKFSRVSDGERADEGQRFVVEGDIDPDLNKDTERDFQMTPEPQEGQTEDMSQGLNPSADATLNAMSMDELVKLAADEEVNLQGAKTKKQVIERINQAQSDRAGL